MSCGDKARPSELDGLGELMSIVMPGSNPTPLPYNYEKSPLTRSPAPETLKEQLDAAQDRLAKMRIHPPVAVVEPKICTACYACLDSCAFEAITVGEYAVVDPAKCSACGDCLLACPTGAITLEEPS